MSSENAPTRAELAARIEQLEQRQQAAGRQTIQQRVSRRDIILGGIATGAAALALGGSGRVAAQSGGEFPDDFHGMALLIGLDDDKPSHDSSFFDDLAEWNFVYVAEDTGARYVSRTDDESWGELKTHLPTYATGNLPDATKEGEMVHDSMRGTPAWWDGTNYEFPAFVDDVLTEPQTVENTTTREIVWSPDINRDSLIEGRVYQLDLHGRFSTANNSDQFTVDINIAGTDTAQLQNAPANATDSPWTLESTFSVREDGENGILKANTRAVFTEHPRTARHTTINVDTTAAQALQVALTWGAADPENSVTLEQAHLKQMG